MNEQTPDAHQSIDSQASIDRLRKQIHGWFDANPNRTSAVYGIALFGSRAVGRSDPTLSDWDLFLICNDDAPDGPLPSDELLIFEGCATEWHTNSFSGYLNGLNTSSLSLSCAVDRYGVPLYGSIPRVFDESKIETRFDMNQTQLIGSLVCITAFGANLTAEITTYLSHKSRGFPVRTSEGDPYVPELFKFSSNFAEHVSKLIVAFRRVTPSSIHDLVALAQHLDLDDPYRERIAALNGALRDANISKFAVPSPPQDKAQEEPTSRSTERSVDSVRLLRDFLEDHESDFAIVHEPEEMMRRLEIYVQKWQDKVDKELSAAYSENPSAQWLGSMSQDAGTISRLLVDLHNRTQPV